MIAPAEVGTIGVEAHSLRAAVVWQGRVLLTFVHILAVKAIPLHAHRADTGERSGHVSAVGKWVASSILVLAFLNVYNLSKMGQCQGNSPKMC